MCSKGKTVTNGSSEYHVISIDRLEAVRVGIQRHRYSNHEGSVGREGELRRVLQRHQGLVLRDGNQAVDTRRRRLQLDLSRFRRKRQRMLVRLDENDARLLARRVVLAEVLVELAPSRCRVRAVRARHLLLAVHLDDVLAQRLFRHEHLAALAARNVAYVVVHLDVVVEPALLVRREVALVALQHRHFVVHQDLMSTEEMSCKSNGDTRFNSTNSANRRHYHPKIPGSWQFRIKAY